MKVGKVIIVVGFQDLKAVLMKSSGFWHLTPYSPLAVKSRAALSASPELHWILGEINSEAGL